MVPQPFRAFLVLCALLVAQPASADLAAALRAASAGDWPAARAAAQGEIARDIVEWHRLRAGEGTWGDYRAFLARRPDWPGLALLAEKGEDKIPDGADPAAVTAYFAGQPPRTGAGLVRLAAAYRTLGRTGDAEASLVQGWRTLLFRAADQQALLAAYGDVLRPHHEARLDMLLWRGAELNARQMLPLVTPGWQRLAAARMALREMADGVDALIAAVPEELRGDPGLAFERFQWRARKDRNDDAIALALERSASAEDLGRPDVWANRRAALARWALREGKAEAAYRLAASHRMTEGADYADLEWLAGYIALRFRNDAATALRHFRAFRAVVETPISLGRAGYWEGRALEALGDREGAQLAYELGGEHQTSFYGLLAAEKAGLPMDMSLATGGPEGPDWRQAPFMRSSVLQAAMAIREAGDRLLFTRFVLHLAEGFDTAAYIQAGDMALALGEPYTAVALGKQAAERNIIIARAYFPVTTLADTRFEVPTELVLAIARRESEFNPAVVSSAGARGLMQVMPGTAEDMARALGIEYAPGRLTTDPAYNARLGAAYLKRLVDRFGPSPVLVAAGYNAGPARPARWIEERGDPRSDAVDVIDWIEAIPFTETRTYVMRVAESLPIYRARLTGQAQPMRLSAELRGR